MVQLWIEYISLAWSVMVVDICNKALVEGTFPFAKKYLLFGVYCGGRYLVERMNAFPSLVCMCCGGGRLGSNLRWEGTLNSVRNDLPIFFDRLGRVLEKPLISSIIRSVLWIEYVSVGKGGLGGLFMLLLEGFVMGSRESSESQQC